MLSAHRITIWLPGLCLRCESDELMSCLQGIHETCLIVCDHHLGSAVCDVHNTKVCGPTTRCAKRLGRPLREVRYAAVGERNIVGATDSIPAHAQLAIGNVKRAAVNDHRAFVSGSLSHPESVKHR